MTAAPHINGFDDVVFGIMLFSCLFAFFRGLVREILSLIAWIGAGAVTIHYFPAAAGKLHASFRSPVAADIISIAGIYLAALMGFALVNMVIVKSIKSGEGGGVLDNLLGLGFGALRGALILSLGYFLLSIALPKAEYPAWLTQSVTRPYLEKGALLLAQAAPETLRGISSLQQKALGKAQGAQPTPNSANDSATGRPPQDNLGYSNSSTQQLNRLMDSTERRP
ncbi:MAG: CvpA family protein [Alphaproteobacteria bacterium]|nr:CvpA family protein [Alphaproteobacteria bacterium]MDE3015828.1 CvpA family protein [Pseudomonadota bacterium]